MLKVLPEVIALCIALCINVWNSNDDFLKIYNLNLNFALMDRYLKVPLQICSDLFYKCTLTLTHARKLAGIV